jgi:hypothetical protein|tara:strand:+ start:582 stop:788 length:207 start_codon:yes stop_codon:yes gene_type:complete
MGSNPFIKNPEYDFMVPTLKGSDTSNLKVYYVTHAATVYTIVAATYEEALTVAEFAAEDTTKNSESPY